MPGEADEAGGHQPANEENEVWCDFSPEKPCLPLSIEGTSIVAKAGNVPPSFRLTFPARFLQFCKIYSIRGLLCVKSSVTVVPTPTAEVAVSPTPSRPHTRRQRYNPMPLECASVRPLPPV